LTILDIGGFMHTISRYCLSLFFSVIPAFSYAIPSSSLQSTPFSLSPDSNGLTQGLPADSGNMDNNQSSGNGLSFSSGQYIPDALILLSSDETFRQANIDVKELADLSADIITAFNDAYSQSKDTGSMQIFLEISTIAKPPEVCAKDYRQCVLMGYLFEDDSKNKDKAAFEKFTKAVLALKEIHVAPGFDKKIGILFHLNYPVSKASHGDEDHSKTPASDNSNTNTSTH
jgi:hypothetical protein